MRLISTRKRRQRRPMPRRLVRVVLSNLAGQVQDAAGVWRPATPDELERLRRSLEAANGSAGKEPGQA